MEAEMNHTAKTRTCMSNPAAEQMRVVAARNGDEQAFEDLFRRYQRRIFVLALRYTRDREDAEDIVQQTFYQAFVYLQKFEGRSSFCTWVTRIAINQALMLLRRRRGACEVPIDHSSSYGETTSTLEVADPSPDPEANYLQREKTQILSAALRQLRPGMRSAIELREFRELSNRETAAHMGVSLGAAKARVFHARRKLGETLKFYARSR
jgi:RNA polymerase sigma-70 factor (ECF subfamily)